MAMISYIEHDGNELGVVVANCLSVMDCARDNGIPGIEADCGGETERLNEILDADEGARHIGEWSLGTNNRVKHPLLDTLFDEKIGGSFHLTPGQAYDEADTGNRSRIHWDLVLIQTPEYGGGEIAFVGEVIRRDGRFLPDDLQGLNDGLDAA